ncbi:hypothetical protein J6590_102782, partial [Homalodisca vitripennis]
AEIHQMEGKEGQRSNTKAQDSNICSSPDLCCGHKNYNTVEMYKNKTTNNFMHW